MMMTSVKGGTSQACAACKYQRRRCTPDCALAPYFPADKPKTFQNAHRLFGVCKIMKILAQLRDDHQKEEAMKSIIYESDMRQKFPVYGCSWVIWQVKEKIRQCHEELLYVKSLLDTFRNKEECESKIPSTSDQFQPGLQPMNNDLALVTNQFLVDSKNGGYVESGDGIVKAMWMQQEADYYGNNMNIGCSFGINSQYNPSMVLHGLPLQQQNEVSQEYDDMPFDAIADDRQSYIESKEACESSADSRFKDTIQSIDAMSQNHELKSAAAFFSLTSIS